MDPAGIGVLIGIGTMVGGLFLCYLHDRCVYRQDPTIRPLLVRPKPRFQLKSLFTSSTSNRIPNKLQTSSSAHLQTEFA
jgi:hypothetical protein